MNDTLSTPAWANATRLEAFTETLIPDLSDIEVFQSCNGLVMLPMRDTVGGVAFHLGAVLRGEAHIGKRRGRV